MLSIHWQVDDQGMFVDISQLKNRPAHIAVFLHYLLSNSDPSPLVSLPSHMSTLISKSLIAFCNVEVK